ncbi:hypothetical protein BGZ46_005223, partial [Entomortierella lignicola]
STISLSGNILPVFEQLGIFEDLKKDSFRHVSGEFYDTKLKELGSFKTKVHKKLTGYDYYILSRPKLYEILRRQVPAHKISMGKKVLRIKEESDKVTVNCSDNTTYYCSIVVGADGAYSAVRQSM